MANKELPLIISLSPFLITNSSQYLDGVNEQKINTMAL